MSAAFPIVRPGRRHGAAPERSVADRRTPSLLPRPWRGTTDVPEFDRFGPTLDEIRRRREALDPDPAALVEAWHAVLRSPPSRVPLDRARKILSIAIIDRLVPDRLGLELHDEQRFAVWGLLHGRMVQMATGEGKTVTAGIAAAVLASTGMPVHVITVNEYLVERDAEQLRPLHAALGFEAGCVLAAQSDEERRDRYARSIVYVSNKQVVFDYLRDRRMARAQACPLSERLQPLLARTAEAPVMRGLCCAIVDEADSVLIDDAGTPCVLGTADPAGTDTTEPATALGLARTLRQGRDFVLTGDGPAVRLTEHGDESLRELANGLAGIWRVARYRRERVRQALTALHGFQADHHYLVRDGKVLLIDESTGRVMPDRRLQHGLHVMLELKERVPSTSDNTTVAAISVQGFFQRYHVLVGMSGTLSSVRRELRQVYGLDVLAVPEHRPSGRKILPTRVLPDRERQLDALVELAGERQRRGQPVLIGTRTAAFSRQVSERLSAAAIDHDVLSAHQDAEEAHVIEQAGEMGAVTVATNMAGRGTDIPLRGVARSRGGLQVINLQLNESRRVDRQLFGRAARQGDPGIALYLLSLDDELLVDNVPAALLRAIDRFIDEDGIARPSWLANALPWLAQVRCERRRTRARLRLHASRESLERRLAVGGRDV